ELRGCSTIAQFKSGCRSKRWDVPRGTWCKNQAWLKAPTVGLKMTEQDAFCDSIWYCKRVNLNKIIMLCIV
ncbi:MAG: hypothetical protein ACRC91_07550, partial [Aeromonas sp.]